MDFYNFTGNTLGFGIGSPSSGIPPEQYQIYTGPSQPIGPSGFVQVAVYKNSKGTPYLIGRFVYFDGPGEYLDLTVDAPPKFLGRENLVNIVNSYVSLYYSIEPDNVTQLLGVIPLDVWNND